MDNKKGRSIRIRIETRWFIWKKNTDITNKKGRSIRIRIETPSNKYTNSRCTNKKGRSIRIRIETKHSQPYLVGGLPYKKGRSIRIRIETKSLVVYLHHHNIIKKEDPLE